jgi:hypothetical protein
MEDIREALSSLERPALAFSGGCDSSFLLHECLEAGIDFRAYTVATQFQTEAETERAIRFCAERGVPLEVIRLDVLSVPGVADNGQDRCYLCKKAVFSAIEARSRADGCGCIIDGTNATDDPSLRPGMRALEDIGAVSPLRECGLTKEEVRELSREAGLPTWDLPSDSCLATRLAAGMPITEADLRRIADCEAELGELGFRGHRFRYDGSAGRFEVPEDQMHLLETVRREAEAILLKYCDSVTYGIRRSERMTPMEILEAVRDGSLSPEEAERMLRTKPFVDLGFAKVDTHRAIRSGSPEVIYGAGKTPEQSIRIAGTLMENGAECAMITRCSPGTWELAHSTFDDAVYHERANIIVIGRPPEPSPNSSVCVVTAGTSDIPVAEEAAVTAETLGSRVDRIYDGGVAGIHRLLANMEPLSRARAVVAVAGMEGALPSVVGGLVNVPVIAVPTSVGYGASFGGVAALLAMMNSCSSDVSVVNIDNGFGAGYIASMIDRRTAPL